MFRPRSFLALGLLPVAALLAASCEQAPVPFGLVLAAPQSISDADSVELYVFPAKGRSCDANTGQVDSIPKTAKKFTLKNDGCADGLAWCGELELDKSTAPQMFAALAKEQGATTLQGCTSTAVTQDPLEVTIEMKQIIEPKCCGDGKLQVGELCDTGNDATCPQLAQDEVCFPDCSTQEVLLSIDDFVLNKKPYLTNEAGSKEQLAMAFCPGNPEIKNALRAVFRSHDSKAAGGGDINLRVLSEDLYSIAAPEPLSLQLRLPVACTMWSGTAAPADQQDPSIAWVSQNATLMVYSSNEKVTSSPDIYVVVHTEDVCADVDPSLAAVLVTDNSPGAITPDVARGPDGQGLIVWDQKGQITGKIWNNGVLGNAIQIGAGGAPKVAGNAKGWVVVYQGSAGDGDILQRPIGLDGTPGTEEVVNAETAGLQTQPDIAMLDDGTYVVVWKSGDDIWFQRFQNGMRVAEDQAEKLNNDAGPGPHLAPAVGAPSTGGGFFAAAWENNDGTISARFIGEKTRFLFNSIDGKNGAFPASHLGIQGSRHRPAVAIGKYVALGWEDSSDMHSGVFVRRFPLPQ